MSPIGRRGVWHMSEVNEPTEFGEYWAILWRRKNWFIGPFAAVLVVSAALAFLLPPRLSIRSNDSDRAPVDPVERRRDDRYRVRTGTDRTASPASYHVREPVADRREVRSLSGIARIGPGRGVREGRQEHRSQDGRRAGEQSRPGRPARRDDRVHSRVQREHAGDRAGGHQGSRRVVSRANTRRSEKSTRRMFPNFSATKPRSCARKLRRARRSSRTSNRAKCTSFPN